MMKIAALFLSLLLAAPRAQAGTEAMQMKAYLALKQDSDLYVGEGTADLKDFGGDQAKALEAARQRARGSLAEAVQVHVKSDTAEALKSEDGKVSEKIESRTQSHADLVLENVKFLDLSGLPAAGQVTVLASLSKEDYRRQLAGKSIPLFVPENGLRLSAGWLGGGWTGGNDTPIPGIEFYWHGFVTGVALDNARVATNPSATQPPDIVLFRLWDLSLGYDLTPWHWKVQPFVPLRVSYELVNGTPYIANLFGASAGLGLRYWPTDAVALDLGMRFGLGFNRSTVTNGDGKPYIADDGSGKALEAVMTGEELTLGLLWSGF